MISRLTSPFRDRHFWGGFGALAARGIVLAAAAPGAPVADGITTGSPTLTEPTIGQAHALGTSGVAAGPPILGTPDPFVTYVDSPQLIGTGTAPPTVTLSGDYAHLTGLRVRVVSWSPPFILVVEVSIDGGDTWVPINDSVIPMTVEIPGAPGAFLTFPGAVAYSDDNFYEVSVSTA